MSQSSAAYLRSLDQQATPRPWHVLNGTAIVVEVRDQPTVVALRNLLPELAAVVEKAEETVKFFEERPASIRSSAMIRTLKTTCDALAAAIAREQSR